MVSISNIRNKLAVKIFTKLGSTFLVSSLVSSSTDSYGDATKTYATAVTVTAVPYNIVGSRSYERFGDLQKNELDCVFDYLASINIDSSVRFNSKNYVITAIDDDFVLLDSTIAKLARLSEII